MKCLYCDKTIVKQSFRSLFIKEDPLCYECREKLGFRVRHLKIDDIDVEYLYDYRSIFSSILLQYKECLDEALSVVFAYEMEDYIFFKYHGYKLCYVPSSDIKMDKRGFHPMKMILNNVKIKEVEVINMIEQCTQENKNSTERKKMEHNFVYDGPIEERVLIVDDVLTSGSTIKGVYNALKPYCREIKVLVMASAMQDEKTLKENDCVRKGKKIQQD
ncbi:MAG: phosphoribosyltransferase family protein [Erysipelotrichaceae bacterium]|nr:phosphoribosyltransferase family protein [Erysipelotrichaceae bacterium]